MTVFPGGVTGTWLCFLLVWQERDCVSWWCDYDVTDDVTGKWPDRHSIDWWCDRNVTWSWLCWLKVWQERYRDCVDWWCDRIVTWSWLLNDGVTGTWLGTHSGDQHGPHPNHGFRVGGTGHRVRRGGKGSYSARLWRTAFRTARSFYKYIINMLIIIIT